MQNSSLFSQIANSKRLQRAIILTSVACVSLTSLANVGSTAFAREVSNLNRFLFEINAYKAKDNDSPPPANGTEFIGSSSIQKWSSLDKDFAEFHAFNRGFGGSTIPEVNHFCDQIVIPYKPSRIVFYAGTNDIAAKHSAERVEQDFETFATMVHKALPKTRIYFISMSVAPCRVEFADVYLKGNDLIKAYIAKTPYLSYIDITPVMKDASGKLKESYFGPDRLHMTREGYEAWIPVIKTALSK